MVVTLIKAIEDLHHVNTYRITRGAGARFLYLARTSLRVKMEAAEDPSRDPATGDEFVEELKLSVNHAIEGLEDAANQRSEEMAKSADDVFAKLLDDIQPVKEKMLRKDPNAWTAMFDAPPPEMAVEGIELEIQTMSGKSLKLRCPLTETINGVKAILHKRGSPPPRDQTMMVGDMVLDKDVATLHELDLKDGTTITLLCQPYCPVCEKTCECADCHGAGRYGEGCKTCGVRREDCIKCAGPCKCYACHGKGRYGCNLCGIRPPCWGGDTFVLLPDGSAKKVRDCRVGDEVRTLRGSKKIARVWGRDPTLPQNVDTEVVLLDGVWITSHHPVIHEGEWVFPADFNASALWSKRRHVVPDMYNFELEGHDDTILLWGGGGLVISCTIGKYLGPRFGNGICTRRSTRCRHACAQCDAVYVDGLMHNRIPSEMRWCRFPDFPQVEWKGDVSEFALAVVAKQNFVPPRLPSACAYDVRLTAPTCRNCADSAGTILAA
jgi:hypothetical protein